MTGDQKSIITLTVKRDENSKAQLSFYDTKDWNQNPFQIDYEFSIYNVDLLCFQTTVLLAYAEDDRNTIKGNLYEGSGQELQIEVVL